METACKLCVFAKYEGKTQVDCKLKQLDVYRRNAVEIIDAYDDDNEFFVVKGHCNYFRSDRWLKKYEKVENFDPIVKAIAEAEFDVDWFVYCDAATLHKLSNTLSEINKWKIKPKRVIIVYHDPQKLSLSALHDIVFDGKYDFAWQVKMIMEIFDNGDLVDLNRATKIALKGSNTVFFGWSESGSIPPADFICTIRTAINKKAMSFALTKFDGGFCCYRAIAESFACYNILENIDAIVKETGETHMVKQVSDL